MTQPVESNARENRPTRGRHTYLAKRVPCHWCTRAVVLAVCRDGRWRTFDEGTVPAAPAGVWSWRKRLGMEETDLVDGHRLHVCAEYAAAHDGVTGLGDLLGGVR